MFTAQMVNVVSAGKMQRLARFTRPLPPPPPPQMPPPADSASSAPAPPAGAEPQSPPTGAGAGARSPTQSQAHPYQNVTEIQRALARSSGNGADLTDAPPPSHGAQKQPSQQPQSWDLRFIDDSTIRSSNAGASEAASFLVVPVPAPRQKKMSVDSILSSGESTGSSVASVPELNAGFRVCHS